MRMAGLCNMPCGERAWQAGKSVVAEAVSARSDGPPIPEKSVPGFYCRDGRVDNQYRYDISRELIVGCFVVTEKALYILYRGDVCSMSRKKQR